MKKALMKVANKLYYMENGKIFDGKNPNMRGDCTGLSGDCSGLRGNCSGLSGDLDECEITDEERQGGVDIQRLVNPA